MATVTARTLPWYAPPRMAHAWRRVKRYPVVSLSILTFVLVIPAVYSLTTGEVTFLDAVAWKAQKSKPGEGRQG